jgi:hypothetical protein
MLMRRAQGPFFGPSISISLSKWPMFPTMALSFIRSHFNSETIVGFVEADPEQRQAKGHGLKFTVLTVVTQRA